MINFIPVIIADLISRGEADLQTGPFGTQLKAKDYVEVGNPVINVRNIGYGDVRNSNLEFIDEKTAERLHVHRLKQGDIVFGRKGAVDRHALINAETDGWFQGSDCLRLRIQSDQVSNEFVSYFFQTAAHKGWMEAMCSFGATMSSLNQDIVKRIVIRMPCIEIQRKIVGILSCYDALIKTNKRRMALLEALSEQMYREWFVRNRFPGHKEQIDRIELPNGWTKCKLKNVVKFTIGGGWGEDISSAVSPEPAYVIRGTDVPKLNAGDYTKFPFRFHTSSNLRSRRLQQHDFVFEVSGGSKDQLLGRNAQISQRLLNFLGQDVICASFCRLIRFDEAKVSPYFMRFFLKLYYEHDLVSIYQVQSTGISNYHFESFLANQDIVIPSGTIQDRFNELVMPIIAMREELAVATCLLEQTRDLLLPRLLSGKLTLDQMCDDARNLAYA